jgi:senataxin
MLSTYLGMPFPFDTFTRSPPIRQTYASIQYRMHPEISQLPSRVFYKGQLKDGPGMAEKAARAWHASNMFGPYIFYNILRGQESPGSSHSLMNKAEVQVAVGLYDRLLREFSSVDFNFRVGVVSMYRAQILELRRAFESRFGLDVTSQVDFNTVDGFQGQEKDIIILSCVRAGPGLQNVGFLSGMSKTLLSCARLRLSRCSAYERCIDPRASLPVRTGTLSYIRAQ